MNTVFLSLAFLLAAPPEISWPGAAWQPVDPAAVEMDAELLADARDYALTGGGSGFVTRHGKLVMSWPTRFILIGFYRKKWEL